MGNKKAMGTKEAKRKPPQSSNGIQQASDAGSPLPAKRNPESRTPPQATETRLGSWARGPRTFGNRLSHPSKSLNSHHLPPSPVTGSPTAKDLPQDTKSANNAPFESSKATENAWQTLLPQAINKLRQVPETLDLHRSPSVPVGSGLTARNPPQDTESPNTASAVSTPAESIPRGLHCISKPSSLNSAPTVNAAGKQDPRQGTIFGTLPPSVTTTASPLVATAIAMRTLEQTRQWVAQINNTPSLRAQVHPTTALLRDLRRGADIVGHPGPRTFNIATVPSAPTPTVQRLPGGPKNRNFAFNPPTWPGGVRWPGGVPPREPKAMRKGPNGGIENQRRK